LLSVIEELFSQRLDVTGRMADKAAGQEVPRGPTPTACEALASAGGVSRYQRLTIASSILPPDAAVSVLTRRRDKIIGVLTG
jgi:hypothetical protein